MSSGPREIVVTLYTKPGCHLCEPVADTIEEAAKTRRFRFETRNILDDPLDYERYQHAIPVVTVAGREVARYRLSLQQLLDALDAAAALRRPSYRRYWHALYRRDVAAAGEIVEQARRAWKPGQVYLRLFQPALALSGKLWAAGDINYHDEHFVTYHTLRFMRRVRHDWIPRQTNGPLAVATGAGQESHLIGLRMVCDFLAAENWRIHWLAANDRGVLRKTAAALRPEALLISVGLDTALGQAARMIADLRDRRFKGLVIVGGAAINKDVTRVQRLGADLTAINGRHLVRLLRRRVGVRRSR